MALNAYKADYATQLETARTITVGGKSLDFDGTQDLLFTLADIGAVPRVAAGATNQGIYIDSNGTIQTMTYQLNKTVPSDAVFTDTHYTTKLVVGKSNSTTHTATTVSEDTYLRLFDNSTARQTIKIAGAGGTSISSAADGTLTITSSDNNTTYTFADGTNGTFTVTPSGSNTPITVNTGVPAIPESATSLETARNIDGVAFDGTADIMHYGVCSTAAATATKEVACSDFNLVNGAWIAVRFTVANTAAIANLKLDVNGTGAKSMKYRGGNISNAGNLAANGVYIFVYDSAGDVYHRIGDINTNTTYSALSQADATGGTATTARLITAKVLDTTITNKIAALDGDLNSTTPGAGKTVTEFSQTDGVVSVKFEDIEITKSQISDFPTNLALDDHTHGNITNDGKITAAAVAIGSGDNLVIIDNSNSNKLIKSTLTFGTDGTKALTNSGTWAPFISAHQDLSEYAKLASPVFTGTPQAPTPAAGTNSTQIATTAFVQNIVSGLAGPMKFMGTLGTGGTITSLPTAATANTGYTYKVITAATYASQECRVGDMWISNGTTWNLIPSGDDPIITMDVTDEVLSFAYSA